MRISFAARERRRHVLLVAGTVLALLSSCSSEDGRTVPGERPVIIPTTTKVADGQTREALESFDPDTGEMRFGRATQALSRLELDDVLVSEPSAAAPHGFLRKVKAIRRDGEAFVLETTQANLTDAIHSGALRGEGELSAADVADSTALVEGVTLRPAAGTQSGYEFEVDFSETVIDFEQDGLTTRVRVDGHFYFSAGYGIDLGIDACWDVPPVCVDRFEAWVGVRQRAELSVAGETNFQVTREKKVAEYWFKPICFLLGPVPVCLTPRIAMYVGATGDVRVSFEYGASQSAEALLGVRWTDKNGWRVMDPAPRFDVDLAQTFKVNAALAAGAYTKAEAALLLYGVAGTAVGAKLEVSVDAGYPRDPFWIVQGAFSGYYSFMVDLPVVGKVAESTGQLFSLAKEFGRSPNQPPHVVVGSPVVRVEHGATVNLYPTKDPTCASLGFGSLYCVGDPEDGTPSFTLTSDLDGNLPADPAYRFAAPGRRTITIRATDKRGATASATLVADVVNTPPTAYGSADTDTVPATVPMFVSAFASDPNSELDCTALNWSVTAPDTVQALGQGQACYGKVVFNVEGTRSVRLSATDPEGATSQTRTFSVMVTRPPEVPVPQVLAPLSVHECADEALCPALGEGAEIITYQPTGLTLYFKLAAQGGSGALTYGFSAACITCVPPTGMAEFASNASGEASRLFAPATWTFLGTVSDDNMAVTAGGRTIRIRYMPR